MKAWMNSNFGQMPPLTTALAAIDLEEIDISTFSWLILRRSFLNENLKVR